MRLEKFYYFNCFYYSGVDCLAGWAIGLPSQFSTIGLNLLALTHSA